MGTLRKSVHPGPSRGTEGKEGECVVVFEARRRTSRGRVEALQALAAVSKLDEEDIVDVLLGISDIYLFLNAKYGGDEEQFYHDALSFFCSCFFFLLDDSSDIPSTILRRFETS